MAKIVGEYRVSTLGVTFCEIGFIHASTCSQLGQVARRFYSAHPFPLVVLEMDDDLLRATGIDVRFEDGGDGELYPHIYGAITPDLVVAVLPAAVDDTGRLFY